MKVWVEAPKCLKQLWPLASVYKTTISDFPSHSGLYKYVYKYIYIYIYPSQSTRDTSIAQLLPVLRWCIRQLQALLWQNPQRICAHKYFNASCCIHIFAGIAYCSVGGLHGSCQSAIFCLHHSTRMARTPSTALSGGAYKCTPLGSLLGKSK